VKWVLPCIALALCAGSAGAGDSMDPVVFPYWIVPVSWSIKEECLSRMIFFGERSLQRATREFAAYYHEERNHRGIANRLISPKRCAGTFGKPVRCSERLGGLLRFYHRVVASRNSLAEPPGTRWSAE